jgi:tetratricopeptide (TPR) repeat protein
MQAPALELATQALDAQRPAEARQILAKAGKTAHALALMARTYHALGKKAEAAQLARQLDATTDPAAQHALALYHAQSGNRKRAAELEQKFAMSPQADAAAPARAAFLLAETGDTVNAIALGERALAGQDRLEVRQLLARLYEGARQADKAAAQHEAIIKSRPYDEEALGEYGQALLRLGRFQQATAALEDAKKKFDKSPQIELALGVAYYSQRRFEEASVSFLRVIDLDPAVPQPYVFLGRMLDQMVDRIRFLQPRFAAWHKAETKSHLPPLVYAKSLPIGDRKALLEESIRREGNYWESHFELALVLEHERDWAGAAREFEWTVKLDPTQSHAHYRVARIYDRLGRPQDAARHRQSHANLTQQAPAANGAMQNQPQ